MGCLRLRLHTAVDWILIYEDNLRVFLWLGTLLIWQNLCMYAFLSGDDAIIDLHDLGFFQGGFSLFFSWVTMIDNLGILASHIKLSNDYMHLWQAFVKWLILDEIQSQLNKYSSYMRGTRLHHSALSIRKHSLAFSQHSPWVLLYTKLLKADLVYQGRWVLTLTLSGWCIWASCKLNRHFQRKCTLMSFRPRAIPFEILKRGRGWRVQFHQPLPTHLYFWFPIVIFLQYFFTFQKSGKDSKSEPHLLYK